MRAFAATVVFAVVIGTAVPASAQLLTQKQESNPSGPASLTAPAPAQRALAPLTVPAQPKRPVVLLPLYLSYATLQMSDAALTLKALRIGGHEANGLMSGLSKHPVAFYAVKAAATSLSIVGAELMWRQGRRKSAVGVMIASNVLFGVVVRHNAQVIKALSR